MTKHSDPTKDSKVKEARKGAPSSKIPYEKPRLIRHKRIKHILAY